MEEASLREACQFPRRVFAGREVIEFGARETAPDDRCPTQNLKLTRVEAVEAAGKECLQRCRRLIGCECRASAATATSCSAKRGLPPACSTIRSRTSGAIGSTASLSTSLPSASAGSGSSSTRNPVDVGPPQPGRASSSSRRARQTTRIGPSAHSPRYWIKSRSVGSAQWMSSNTTTSGRSRAIDSSRRRTAHSASPGAAGPRRCP